MSPLAAEAALRQDAPPRPARPRAWQRWLLLVASSACALALAEVLARLTTPHHRGTSWYHYDARYEFRHRSRLDVVTTEWGEGEPWRLRTNSRGFRGDEWSPAPAAGVRRVLVAGDSFTLGDAVEEDEAFPAVAARHLSERRVEILSLGVSAWGPENAVAYLETEGADIRAHELVYAFYAGNDMADWRRSRLFDLKAGRLERRPPRRPGTLERVRSAVRSFPLYEALLAKSQLFNVVRVAVIRAWARNRRISEGQLQPPSPRDPAGAPDIREDAAHTLAAMDRMADIARNRFGGFRVVLIPSSAQLLEGPPASSAAAQARALVRSWAAKRGVPCLDLAEVFPRTDQEIRSLYFERDFHLNVRGNALVGELVARSLSNEGGSN